jgi:hypothetical protein
MTMADYVQNKGLLNSESLDWIGDTAQIAKAAGHYGLIKNVGDIGSTIRNIVLGQKDEKTIFTVFKVTHTLWSTAPFDVTPFIALLENGETITDTDIHAGDWTADMVTALGTETQELQMGASHKAKMVYDNGTPYFKLEFVVDITASDLLKRYVASCLNREFTEDAPAYIELKMGLAILAPPTAAQTINWFAQSEQNWHSIKRKLKVL